MFKKETHFRGKEKKTDETAWNQPTLDTLKAVIVGAWIKRTQNVKFPDLLNLW